MSTIKQQKEEIEALKAQLELAKLRDKFGTWTSKQGNKFLKVKVAGLSRDMLLNVDAYNDLVDMIEDESIAKAIKELEIE